MQVDDSGKVQRLRKVCPKCGPGMFMATHFNRVYWCAQPAWHSVLLIVFLCMSPVGCRQWALAGACFWIKGLWPSCDSGCGQLFNATVLRAQRSLPHDVHVREGRGIESLEALLASIVGHFISFYKLSTSVSWLLCFQVCPSSSVV